MDTEYVKEYIRRNIGRVSTVEPLAANLKISAETLREEFRRSEGVPISWFITLMRVEKAKTLLEDTCKRCFDICFEVGFSREDVGARAFKKVTGMTMLEHRAAEMKKKGRSRTRPVKRVGPTR